MMNIESLLLPGRPQGSPDELRSVAHAWLAASGNLREMIEKARARTESLSASWQGEAKTAFEREWTALVTAVTDASDEMAKLAATVTQTADRLEDAQRRYDVTMEAAAVTGVIGMLGSFVTFGASDAAAGAAATAGTAGAVEAAVEATSLASQLLAYATQVAQQIAIRFVVSFGVDLTAQAGIGMVTYHDLNPLGHLDYRSGLSVAVGNAAPVKLPGGSALTKAAIDGSLKAGFNALSQEIGKGRIDPAQVLFSGASGAVRGAGGLGALKSKIVTPAPGPASG